MSKVERTTASKSNTIFDACRTGDCERVLAYVDPANNGCVTEGDNAKMTMLHHAAFGGHAAIVEALLARPEIEVDANDALKWTPLLYAASAGHAEVARLLLDGGANTSAKDEYKRSALHMAVTSSARDDAKVATIRTLLKNGVNPRLKSVAGTTAYGTAVANGASDAVLAEFPEHKEAVAAAAAAPPVEEAAPATAAAEGA
jgi:ankyrin repeat protein